MSTELISSRYGDLDLWPTGDAVQAMLEGQLAAAAAVQSQVAAIAAAADAAADRLGGKGRLVYVGAGTSGRLAVQDGVELGPTYNWGSDRLVYALAGGMDALLISVEGAEDDAAAGEEGDKGGRPGRRRRRDRLGRERADAIHGCGDPSSSRSRRADDRHRQQWGTPLLEAAEHPILLDTGAEIVAGSTRMKAGTAQKIALNLFSTAVMLRLGRVYKGLMVDMRVSNRKLRTRAAKMICEISGVKRPAAETALDRTGGNIKLAALVALGAEPEGAASVLREAGDNLRIAISRIAAAGR